MREKKDARLFFALWPDDALRRRLADAANRIAITGEARRVPERNLHLTLHFVGNVFFDEMDSMREQARQVEAAGFNLLVDCTGQFSKPRVGWLGCRAPVDALAELHRQLGERLQRCGYQPEKRAYHPHVTIARKFDSIATDTAFEPIDWPVHSFALVEVQAVANGVQYRLVESFPLS